MEIGILSDTHGYLDPKVFTAFRDCDEIWHAGDFGSLAIARQLAEFKPFRGVHGNIDDAAVRAAYPEDQRFEFEGVDVWMTHIAGYPGRYSPRVLAILKRNAPQVLICGHSHLLRVDTDRKHGQMLCVNPGAAGNYGEQLIRTVLKVEVANGEFKNMRVVELGPRRVVTKGH
jgi:putative phosphoesterase